MLNAEAFHSMGATAAHALPPAAAAAAADRRILGIWLGSEAGVGQTDMEEQDGLNAEKQITES